MASGGFRVAGCALILTQSGTFPRQGCLAHGWGAGGRRTGLAQSASPPPGHRTSRVSHRARTALRYPTHAHADHPTIVRRHMSGHWRHPGGTLRLSRAHRGHPAPGRSPPSVRSPLVPLRSSPKSHSLIEGRWSRLPGGGGGIRPRIWFSACAEIVLWSFRDSGQDAYIGRRAQWPGRPPLWGFAGDPARVVRAGERE